MKPLTVMVAEAQKHSDRAVRLSRILEICGKRELRPATALYRRVCDLAVTKGQEAGTAEDASETLFQINEWTPDQFRKYLRRGHRLYNQCVDLICEVFALLDPEDKPPAEKLAAYKRLIWIGSDSPEISRRVTAYGTAVWSETFVPVTIPAPGLGDAEAFYNAADTGLAAIVDNYDIERLLVTRSGRDLSDEIQSFLRGRAEVRRFFVQGKVGSGKTTTLNRLVLVLAKQNFRVMRCDAYVADSRTFVSELLRVCSAQAGPTAVLFDDPYRLQTRGIDLSIVSTAVLSSRVSHPVALVFADNWVIRRGFNPLDKGSLSVRDQLAFVNELNNSEVEALLDKLIKAERGGLITNIAQTAPRAERISYISTLSDRLVAHTLLKLRYCKQITELLRVEYESIADDEAKGFYRDVVLLTSLDVGTPSFMATRRWKRLQSDFAVGRFQKMYFSIEHGEYRIRHPILVRPLAAVLFPDGDARPVAIGELLGSLDLSRTADREFVIRLLTTEGLAQRISHFLERAPERIRDLIRNLQDRAESFEREGIGSNYYALLGTLFKDVLADFDRAEDAFERAYGYDEDNPYVLRQRAWLALRQARFDVAESRAREAIEAWPEDEATIAQCAFILSWCSKQGFETAGVLYRKLKPDQMSRNVAKHWERFQEAEAVLKYMHKDVDSESFLETLHAPSFIWRARNHATKYIGRALFNELATNIAAEGTITLDSELVDAETGEFQDVRFGRDRKLRGLLKANLARQKYEEWRDFGQEIDTGKLESLFREAMQLGPDEPFTVCWYGTFLKEVRNDYAGANSAYEKAIKLAKSSKAEWIRQHPMFENNTALLIMDGVYRQVYRSAELRKAFKYLASAIKDMEDSGSRFLWPIVSMEQLRAQAQEFREELPSGK